MIPELDSSEGRAARAESDNGDGVNEQAFRLDEPTIAYFKALADETGIAYQTLINSYLRDCAESKRRPSVRWAGRSKGAA